MAPSAAMMHPASCAGKITLFVSPLSDHSRAASAKRSNGEEVLLDGDVLQFLAHGIVNQAWSVRDLSLVHASSADPCVLELEHRNSAVSHHHAAKGNKLRFEISQVKNRREVADMMEACKRMLLKKAVTAAAAAKSSSTSNSTNSSSSSSIATSATKPSSTSNSNSNSNSSSSSSAAVSSSATNSKKKKAASTEKESKGGTVQRVVNTVMGFFGRKRTADQIEDDPSDEGSPTNLLDTKRPRRLAAARPSPSKDSVTPSVLPPAPTTSLPPSLPPPQPQPQPQSVSQPKLEPISVPRYRTGLKNSRNKCYMNATLQALASVRQVAASLSRPMGEKQQSEHPFSTALVSHLQNLDTLTLSQKVTDALDLHRLLCARFSDFVGSQQHDAHEFLMALLECALPVAPLQGRWRHLVSCADCRHVEQGQHFETFVTWSLNLDSKPWSAKTSAVSTNSSSSSSSGRSSANRKNSDAAENGPVATIENLLMQNCGTEQVERKCEACKSKRGVKAVEVAEHPQVLVLHLKRFEAANASKIEKRQDSVAFGETLQLDDGPRYRLRAVVHHMGTADAGHYTADVLGQTDGGLQTEDGACGRDSDSEQGWWHCDDSITRRTTWEEVVEKRHSAYVLFYEVEEPRMVV